MLVWFCSTPYFGIWLICCIIFPCSRRSKGESVALRGNRSTVTHVWFVFACIYNPIMILAQLIQRHSLRKLSKKKRLPPRNIEPYIRSRLQGPTMWRVVWKAVRWMFRCLPLFHWRSQQCGKSQSYSILQTS